MKEKQSNIIYIPARRRIKTDSEDSNRGKLRVAAYCRVSTESEEQAGSFTTQVNHYTNYISKNPEWQLVDIFADEGITGTNTKNRKEFNRMIDECMAGEIDLIITKSISRFARNTVDCLNYIRQLKEKRVAVFFEKENINTLDSTGEILITIMASLAQQESESISKNIKLGLQYRYQAGQVRFNTTNFLGYDTDETGHLIINEKQAKVVKRIFKEYLEGKGTGIIARGLMEDGILTGSGRLIWSGNDINRIISNEKYMGDALLQKTYTVDCLTKERVKNDGTVPQYYIEDNHEPIVSKEVFNLAQQEKARRSNLYTGKRKQKRFYQGKYALTGKVRCSNCQDIYRRITWTYKGNKRYVWRCVNRVKKDGDCPSRTIPEDDLHSIILDTINQMVLDKDEYLHDLSAMLKEMLDDQYDETTDSIDEDLHAKQKELVQMANSKDDYERIADEIYHLREKKQELMIENATREEKRRRWADIQSFLKSTHTAIEKYDDSLVNRLVEKVLVTDDSIEILFKTGQNIIVEK